MSSLLPWTSVNGEATPLVQVAGRSVDRRGLVRYGEVEQVLGGVSQVGGLVGRSLFDGGRVRRIVPEVGSAPLRRQKQEAEGEQ
jgi:hypothetical protein